MKAIILVAGYATRLYPLTKNKPKALLELDGKPIIEYLIEEVNTIDDVDEIILVSNEAFVNHFKRWKTTYDNKKLTKLITIISDGTKTLEERLGAIGDIQFVIEKFNIDENIIVLAGDNYFTYPLKEFYESHLEIDKDMICVKELNKEDESIKRFAAAELDDNNKVIHLEEKPKNPRSNLAVFATYMYKKDTIPLFEEYLDGGNNPDSPGYFVQWLYRVKDVHAYIMNGDCFDIGTIEAYEYVNEYVKNENKSKK